MTPGAKHCGLESRAEEEEEEEDDDDDANVDGVDDKGDSEVDELAAAVAVGPAAAGGADVDVVSGGVMKFVVVVGSGGSPLENIVGEEPLVVLARRSALVHTGTILSLALALEEEEEEEEEEEDGEATVTTLAPTTSVVTISLARFRSDTPPP